jgi:hypothetical protein
VCVCVCVCVLGARVTYMDLACALGMCITLILWNRYID